MRYTLLITGLSELELKWIESIPWAVRNEQEGHNDAKDWLLNPPSDEFILKLELAFQTARRL